MTPDWSDDLSGSTLEEVVRSQSENRAWHRELRRTINALMDSKLAKQISPDQYAAARKPANEDVAECKRRGAKLVNEIMIRSAHNLTLVSPRG